MHIAKDYKSISWIEAPTLRVAVEADAEKLLKYYSVLATEPVNNSSIRRGVLEQTPEQQREMIRWYRQTANAEMFVLDAGSEIVGVLKLTGKDFLPIAHNVELSLNVHPKYRSNGYGSMLLQHALEWAESRKNIRRIELELLTRNEGAFRLYERFGFQLEGLRRRAFHMYDEPGDPYLDAYVMAVLL